MSFFQGLLTVGAVISFGTAAKAIVAHPAIYSTSVIEERAMKCSEEQKVSLINDTNEVLAQLCPRDLRKCAWDGACLLKKADGSRDTFSYTRFNRILDRSTFRKLDDGCIYGQGTGFNAAKKRIKTCLDPYFSVAVDPREHLVGEVIFVPKLIGLVLPTGEIHDGYVIARDLGKDTEDRGRDYFSFFSGLESGDDPNNPFVRMMLDNIDYTFDYHTVNEETAAKVRAARNYPNLPKKLQEFYK